MVEKRLGLKKVIIKGRSVKMKTIIATPEFVINNLEKVKDFVSSANKTKRKVTKDKMADIIVEYFVSADPDNFYLPIAHNCGLIAGYNENNDEVAIIGIRYGEQDEMENSIDAFTNFPTLLYDDEYGEISDIPVDVSANEGVNEDDIYYAVDKIMNEFYGYVDYLNKLIINIFN